MSGEAFLAPPLTPEEVASHHRHERNTQRPSFSQAGRTFTGR